MAAVAEYDFFNRAFAGLRQKRSQSFSQNDVGLQFKIFVVRDRRYIDGVLNDTMLVIFLNLQRNLIPHCLLRFMG